MRLDGVRLETADVDAATDDYRRLLGVAPTVGAAGVHRFQLARGAVEIAAGEAGRATILFAEERADETWPSAPDAWHGLRVERVHPADVPPPAAADAVEAIDHVVVLTPSPERAIALWRDRIGLRLAFDEAFPERKVRLLFFRSGGLTFEFASAVPPPAEADGPDRFYGVSYRVADVEARRASLLAAGVDVSEVRPGNKPGTRVATVRSGTAGVPTLLLEAARDRPSA